MRLLWKLLRHHISAAQLAGFALANVIGMTVVLGGVSLLGDVLPLFEGRDALAGNEYMVISKPFDTMSSMLGHDEPFTAAEVDSLRRQPAVRAVGEFESSDFEVYAKVNLGTAGARMATDMFFESVPDCFVDVDSDRWKFDEGSKYLPIVLPRNYLDLYNFGFASARGLPKISAEVVGLLNIEVDVSGNGRRDTYIGYVAGFSERLNTILVPQSFMDYANRLYGTSRPHGASRLIVEVSNPGDEHLALYLKGHGYVVAEGDDGSGRLAYLLRVVVGIVVAVGLLISALAFFVFVLSIYLLVEKNMSKLENLTLLGYSPLRVASPYLSLAAVLGVSQAVAAVALTLCLRGLWLDRLSPMFDGLGAGGLSPLLWAAAVLLVVQLALDIVVIWSKVRSIAR